MFKSLLVIVVLSFTLVGCVSGNMAEVKMADPVQDFRAKQFSRKPNVAGIYIYRNEPTGGAVKMEVALDGIALGQTAQKSYIYTEVRPGLHTITSKAENTSELSIDAVAGKLYYVWQEVKVGFMSPRSELSLVDEPTGKAGVNGCSLLAGVNAAPNTYGGYTSTYQPTLGNVAVVAMARMPDVKFAGFARSKSDAAGKNAGKVFGNCAGGAASVHDPLFQLLSIVGCGLFVAPVAAIVGSAKAPSTEQIDKSEAAMNASLNAKLIQDTLRDKVLANVHAAGITTAEVSDEKLQAAALASDYRLLAADGVDTVLEVELAQVFSETIEQGINPPMLLFMRAYIRVIRAKDNAVLRDEYYSYHGKQLTYTEWVNNNAEQLAAALKSGYEAIAQDITDAVFLLYPYPDRTPQKESDACGIAPIEPQNGGISSLQPTIRWQTFPRSSDIRVAPEEMGRIRNVRYDLIIGIGDNGETPETVYRRDGLTDAMHTVEVKLSPNTRYFWSSRAHFELDERQRVTEWGELCPFASQLIVGGRLYRFYTPKK